MDLLMTIFILELYAAVSALVAIVCVALGYARTRTRISYEPVRITEFDPVMVRRLPDFRPVIESRRWDSSEAP